MRNVIKSILVWGIILTVCHGLWGCKGGKIPELGGISGPATVDEYGYVEYSVSFVNATGATFLWSCDPVDAGKFDKYDSPKTGFTASMVTQDTPVKISVVVESQQFEPVILSRNITIRDVTKLSVGEIDGPDTVEEESAVTYSITATGDTGIKYQWSANPDDLGILDTPQQSATQFTAATMYDDTPVEIQVNIKSDNYEPVVLIKSIIIRDVTKLSVGEIEGPDVVEEGTSVTYSIDATADTGITYQWLAIPDDLGIFYAPQDAVTQFTAAYVNEDTPVEIQVNIKSGNYEPVVKSMSANVRDTGWTHTWGGVEKDRGLGVAIDGSGNAYITGHFQETVDFDPGHGVDEHVSNGFIDVFLSKFDSNGVFQWGHAWGGTWLDRGRGVAIDEGGNVYVTGSFRWEVDFDPGPGEYLVYASDFSVFLSKFDSNGNFLWARTWGGWLNYVSVYGIAIDGDGFAYVTGHFSGTVDFDPGPGVDEYSSNGLYDIFLSKFDSNGEFQWVRVWGGNSWCVSNGVAIDGSGNVYCTGYFKNTVDFDPGPGVDEYTSNAVVDIFLNKFDSAGQYHWVRTWDGYSIGDRSRVAIDEAGNVYVTGEFIGTVDFNPGPGVNECISNGDSDIYLCSFDADGEFQWACSWGGYYEDCGVGIAVYEGSNVYVTGYFGDSVDFNPGSGVDEQTSKGEFDIFLSKFDLNGEFQWARTCGGSSVDKALGAAIDADNNVFIVGFFEDTVDFDPGPGVDEHISNGGADIFLSKFLLDGTW